MNTRQQKKIEKRLAHFVKITAMTPVDLETSSGRLMAPRAVIQGGATVKVISKPITSGIRNLIRVRVEAASGKALKGWIDCSTIQEAALRSLLEKLGIAHRV